MGSILKGFGGDLLLKNLLLWIFLKEKKCFWGDVRFERKILGFSFKDYCRKIHCMFKFVAVFSSILLNRHKTWNIPILCPPKTSITIILSSENSLCIMHKMCHFHKLEILINALELKSKKHSSNRTINERLIVNILSKWNKYDENLRVIFHRFFFILWKFICVEFNFWYAADSYFITLIVKI